MRQFIFLPILWFALLNFQQTQAAGFDCQKASTKVEKLICADKTLSTLDDQLTTQYEKDLKESGESASFIKKAQIRWLTFQRNTCTDKPCLGREYQERLGEKVTFTPDFEEDNPAYLAPSSAYGQFNRNGGFVDLHTIPTKPMMAILDINLTFDNYHLCVLSDAVVAWSENHWQLKPYAEEGAESCQLRIYPAKGKVRLSDPEHQCRYFCGARGYFNDIILTKSKK